MDNDYKEHIKRMEKKHGICPDCGLKMEHHKEIHTFVCECGKRVWYVERVGDNVESIQDFKKLMLGGG